MIKITGEIIIHAFLRFGETFDLSINNSLSYINGEGKGTNRSSEVLFQKALLFFIVDFREGVRIHRRRISDYYL
ncbi:hypothetical protein NP83_08560 [Neobacillus niacini]|nr:hypothetical protein NP83_08560 [Neobacillus niacini]